MKKAAFFDFDGTLANTEKLSVLATLSYRALTCTRSFGNMFSPGTFSAQWHSTSELLRTL